MDHTLRTAVIGIWLILYTTGICINSKPFVELINTPIGVGMSVGCLVMVLVSHTMTNIALLCCFAALLGGLCDDDTQKPWYAYFARGLFVYLILISGFLLLGSSPFENVTQSQYTRLAGVASLFSFMVGYSPDLFVQLANKVEALTKK